LSSVCVILLKQTNKQSENITSLAEVKSLCQFRKVFIVWCSHDYCVTMRRWICDSCSVCFCMCVCEQPNSKSCERLAMKFSGWRCWIFRSGLHFVK